MSEAIDFDQLNTLGDIARYHGRERPTATALTFEGREATFAEFDRRTNQVANALIGEGVGKGQRIAYVRKNSDHYFELLFGAAKMGAVTTPIGWRLAAPEVAYIIENSEAPLVFVGPEVIGHAAEVAGKLAAKPKVIAMEVACDVESYIYLPLLEEMNYIPVEKYTRAPEILAHSRAIAKAYDLYENACLQTEVTELRWEEPRAGPSPPIAATP